MKSRLPEKPYNRFKKFIRAKGTPKIIDFGRKHAKSDRLLGNHKQALNDYKKALKLNPENGLIYYDMSCSMVELRNIGKACDYFKRAIDKGFNDWNQIKQDKCMDRLRSHECYKQIMQGK